jgi:polyhydroxybutyrate depolymerase
MKKFCFTTFIFSFTLVILPGVSADQLYGQSMPAKLHPAIADSIKVGNMERSFYYYVPDGVDSNPKLIFVLHGSTMTAREMEFVTGRQFDFIADTAKNVIIVYPQGYLKYWNDCRKSATYQTKLEHVNEDAFFEKMIDFFSDRYHISRKEVFVAGYSNGGEMCFKLAIEKPELFKGFAAISANLPFETNNDCVISNQPVSMLVMNGTADPINPYNGGDIILPDGMNRGRVMSTEQTMQYWVGLSHCDTTLETSFTYPDIDTADHSSVVEYDYPCPATHKKVVLIKIINGGHNIPNPAFTFWPRFVGNVNQDINAPYLIYHYFMSLP